MVKDLALLEIRQAFQLTLSRSHSVVPIGRLALRKGGAGFGQTHFQKCKVTTHSSSLLPWSPKELLGKFRNMPESRSEHPLVWIDCEMTGLDIENDTILSLACFITGPDLDLFDEEGYLAVIHHDQEALDRMGAWCTQQHGSSGLTAATLASKTTAEEAAKGLLDYIQKYVKQPKKALLAGNTVHTDKDFLLKPPYRPIIKYLHHRILDVSAIKEAARRWSPMDVIKNSPRKKGLHEARQDILESIEEARYYRKVIFMRDS